MRKELFSNVKRMVVKIGTSVISHGAGLDKAMMKKIADDICSLKKKGVEVVVVSSGAIGAGMAALGKKTRPKALPEQQAAAAVGQGILIDAYNEIFRAKGVLCAQILITQEDLVDRQRYLNARNTIMTLLDEGIVPIINENDTVSTDEIKFGDNDKLSGLVANLVEGDVLVILSDIDGLYEKEAGQKKNLIKEVKDITHEIEKHALGTDKEISVGGMITKIKTAKMVTSSGVYMVIANGKTDSVITRILEGEDIGTLFYAKKSKMGSREKWLAFTSKVRGKVIVDEGAKEALAKKGKSLLATGITAVDGNFKAGDCIAIFDSKHSEIARGLTNYSSDELKKIKGKKTQDIESLLGYKYYDEVVHRDNLVLL